MDVHCHTHTIPTSAGLREFGISDAIRQPFVTLDLHQPQSRLSIFISNTPEGRALAKQIIELLQEAFFTPVKSEADLPEFAK
jgi:hypothetical protein